MHPPFGWLSMDGAGTGQRMALASRNPDSDVSDSSCSTAGSEVAGQHAYQGRRSEPRNYRSHHRDLGHYHFGDCDPADDLARPHDEAGPEGSKYAGTSAGVLALADSTGKAHVSASRCTHPYRRGWSHSRRWGWDRLIMHKHKLSIEQFVLVNLRPITCPLAAHPSVSESRRLTAASGCVLGPKQCERGPKPSRQNSSIRAHASARWLEGRPGAPRRAQQSNTDQQISFRNRWSSSTSSRIGSGSWSRCHRHSRRLAASPSPSSAAARAALIA
jgi:hypothetical protein